MDPDEDIAEERLLKVIEGKKTRLYPEQPAKAGSLTKQQKNPFKILGSFLHFGTPGAQPLALHFNLQMVNSLLWVILAGLGIYLVFDYMAFQEKTKGLQHFEIPGARFEKTIQESLDASYREPVRELSSYTGAFNERNPFTGKEAARARLPEEAPSAPSVNPQELVEGLILVGVNKGPKPEAFVEDTVQKRTYFVTAGQQIRNLTVKEVTGNSVICDYEGMEVQIV